MSAITNSSAPGCRAPRRAAISCVYKILLDIRSEPPTLGIAWMPPSRMSLSPVNRTRTRIIWLPSRT